MITPEQLLLVKKTLPLFNEKSVECAEEMYRNIFRKDASLRGLFSVEFLTPKAGVKPKGNPNCPFAAAKAGKIDESISVQARILAATIVDFAANIDNISSFESKIDRICNLHVSRDIRPAHYGVVAAAFEEAAKTVLGDAVTEEEHNAWMAAVMALAGIFIEREKEIRERAEDRKGAWSGFRAFNISKDDNSIGKIILSPSDGKEVCQVGRGQFSCVRMKVEGLGTVHHNSVVQTSSAKAELPKGPMSPLAARKASNLIASSRLSMEDGKYVLMNPSKVLTQRTDSGEIDTIELSVPVGGQSLMDKNEAGGDGQKAKWENGLLRNVLGGQNFKAQPKGSHLLRGAMANKMGKGHPMMGGGKPMMGGGHPMMGGGHPMGQKSPLSPISQRGPLSHVAQNTVQGSPLQRQALSPMAKSSMVQQGSLASKKSSLGMGNLSISESSDPVLKKVASKRTTPKGASSSSAAKLKSKSSSSDGTKTLK